MAAVVRRRRLELCLTQREAAERAGVSLATWQSVERRGADPASFLDLTLSRVAHGLDLPLTEVFGLVGREVDLGTSDADAAAVRDGEPSPDELIADLADVLRRLASRSQESFLHVYGQALQSADHVLSVLED